MRKSFHIISFATVMVATLAGCAVNPNDPNSLNTLLFGQEHASPTEMQSMTDLAWTEVTKGYPFNSACNDARAKLNIQSRKPADDTTQCENVMRQKQQEWNQQRAQEREQKAQHDAEKRRQADAQIKAQQAAKQRAFDQRIADIRAGNATIRTAREAVAIYHASNGDRLAAQPLVRPDGHNYVVDGVLDPAGGLHDDRFLMRVLEYGVPVYAYVILDSGKASLPPSTHVGSRIAMVGTYTANRSFTTLVGSERVMPVFTALFVQTLN